jgi:hypothetical protein
MKGGFHMHRSSLLVGSAAIIFSMFLPQFVRAAPIVYDFYVVTSGKLGSWSFSNARVHFHVSTNTTSVKSFNVPGSCSNVCRLILINTSGTFTVDIESAGSHRFATFAPKQLFSSIDVLGGGVGIGTYDSTGGFLPAYPIGIQDGIPDCIIGDHDCITPSPAMTALKPDLVSSTTMSGRAWSDTCFAVRSACTSTSPPLHTDRGPFLIYAPYTTGSGTDPLRPGGDPLVTGIFRSILGAGGDE